MVATHYGRQYLMAQISASVTTKTGGTKKVFTAVETAVEIATTSVSELVAEKGVEIAVKYTRKITRKIQVGNAA